MKSVFVYCLVILIIVFIASCSKGGAPPYNPPPDTTSTGGGHDTTGTGGKDTTGTDTTGAGSDSTGDNHTMQFKTMVVGGATIRVNSDGSIVAMVFSDGGLTGTTTSDDLETDTRKGNDVIPHFVNPGNVEPNVTFDSANAVYLVDFSNKTTKSYDKQESIGDTSTVMNFQFTKGNQIYIVYPGVLQVAGYGQELNATAIKKFGSTNTAYTVPPSLQN